MSAFGSFWLRLAWILVTFGSFVAALSSTPSSPTTYDPTQGLSYDDIAKLARKRYQTNDDVSDKDIPPMQDKVAVITGAAGGIGGELSKVVYRLGGTVVALDRNTKGLEKLQETLVPDKTDDDEKNRIVILPTNHENLASVQQASEMILSRFDKIDLLVNNAGLHAGLLPTDGMISAHGKDLAFTVNYLSHFLLTEKLLPRFSDKSRIVHVTSSFHWKVDGSELVPDSKTGIPMAYQADPSLQSPKHVDRSYANTKLAQIWHSRSMAPHLPKGVSSVCVCPLWAATGIGGDDNREFLETYAFPVKDCGPGVTSAINGMLRTNTELGDALGDGRSFVANSEIIDSMPSITKLLSSDWIAKLGWRDGMADLLSGLLLVGQKSMHKDFIIQETSPESFENQENRDKFYQWSKEEVQPWL